MEITRRSFVVGAAATGASLASSNAFGFFQDRPTIKVGLIGAGGRGSGAIRNNLEADAGAVVWAYGDVFKDRLDGSLSSLEKDLGKRVQVGERAFSGFDAYQKVIDSGVDVVVIATPPGFRPIHFAYAIEKGKHVFMEKPVATDAWGCKVMREAAEKSRQKKLSVAAGTQRRHDVAYRECIKRIQDGQLGDVRALYAYWNQGGLWHVDRAQGMNDMEWQLRNWLYFTWTSGDHMVEQHVHNLDVCNWVMGTHPVKALSLAGRQVRTGGEFGHIFDHFATEFEYENGVRMLSMCRQIDGCSDRVTEFVACANGTSNANTFLKGKTDWQFKGDRPNPYVLEHVNLYKSIRGGDYLNEAMQVTESTMTAIMGRTSAYSGQEITWDQLLASEERLLPEKFAFGDLAVPPVAMPGKKA